MQAKKLREQYSTLMEKNFKIEIEISVNSYEPTAEELYNARLLADEVTLFGPHLLYDANISQGFIKTLSRKPTFFWLLSTNDEVKNGALFIIWDSFMKNPHIDFIATNSMNLNKLFSVTDILFKNHFGLCYGLISGVIYRFSTLQSDFNTAGFTSWTGWEHLSVLQSALKRNKSLQCLTLPSELLYSQKEPTMLENKEIYAHGFYGMLCLIFISSESNHDAKMNLRRFMLNNFYKFQFFHRRKREGAPLIDGKNYLEWNERIALSMIASSGVINFLILKTICRVPFFLFAENRVFNVIKKKMDTNFYKKSHDFQDS